MTQLLIDPERLPRAMAATAEAGLDALLVSPGPNLRYLTGYDALPLERLTCLVLRPNADPIVVVPRLERSAAKASPLGDQGVEMLDWGETDDPYALVASLIPTAKRVAVDDHMWAEKVLAFAACCPTPSRAWAARAARAADPQVRRGDRRAARAGAAIDSVHAQMGEWLRAGRTEREVGADIADAILAAGHATVDFVIVGSGPNGASPHHELSDRVIQPGDPVVVDIGGTTPEGYCSDETRTYSVGEPDPEFLASYDVLQAAQEAAASRRGPASPPSRSTRPPATSSSRAGTASFRAPHRPRHRPVHPRGALHRRRQHRVLEPGWRSRSSRASTSRAATARGSRTSSSAPTTAPGSSAQPAAA